MAIALLKVVKEIQIMFQPEFTRPVVLMNWLWGWNVSQTFVIVIVIVRSKKKYTGTSGMKIEIRVECQE